jgi:Skp family chaperone for outer membrane proteins
LPKKLPDNHVFDEDLTIKENRRRVAEHNAKVDELREAYQEEHAKREKQLHKDVVDYIVDCYYMSEEQAVLIENYVYDKYHSCMYDYFVEVDDLADFVKSVIEKE